MKTNGIVLEPEISVDLQPGVVTLLDTTRFGNDGAMANVTWFQLPSGLWVQSYNGTTSLIDCGSGASFNIERAMSVEAWVRRAMAGAFHVIASKTDTAGNQRAWTFEFMNTDELEFAVSKNGLSGVGNMSTLLSPGTYTDVVWLHILCTYLFVTDGTSEMRMYVNGVEIANDFTAVGDIFLSTEPVRLGVLQIGGANDRFFSGYMSHHRIYSYVLTPAQVRARYTATRELFRV